VVAIADVALRPGTPLDTEAQRRATSVYFPGFVVPMLPETLSNGICSLNPKVDRMCFVCDMQVGAAGEVVQSKFYEAVMRSHARLTYSRCGCGAGDAGEAPPIAQPGGAGRTDAADPQSAPAVQVAGKAREQRGAIEFESAKCASCWTTAAKSPRPACWCATTRTS
jgi:ribonuclease R